MHHIIGFFFLPAFSFSSLLSRALPLYCCYGSFNYDTYRYCRNITKLSPLNLTPESPASVVQNQSFCLLFAKNCMSKAEAEKTTASFFCLMDREKAFSSFHLEPTNIYPEAGGEGGKKQKRCQTTKDTEIKAKHFFSIIYLTQQQESHLCFALLRLIFLA